ncbi:MAG: hypothetical protein AAGC63_14555 [Propionicimonas sp.]|nr:hypothetical protein [Propionicimonas sp.]
MSQVWAALDAAWRILLIGIVLGAGLPALFALGVRAMAWGTGGDAEIHAEGFLPKAHLTGRLVAYVIFAIVVSIVILGISYIVAHGLGYNLTFQNGLPTFVPR